MYIPKTVNVNYPQTCSTQDMTVSCPASKHHQRVKKNAQLSEYSCLSNEQLVEHAYIHTHTHTLGCLCNYREPIVMASYSLPARCMEGHTLHTSYINAATQRLCLCTSHFNTSMSLVRQLSKTLSTNRVLKEYGLSLLYRSGFHRPVQSCPLNDLTRQNPQIN